MWSLVWRLGHAFNSIVLTTENISVARASNSRNLRGVKRPVRRGSLEGLPTSRTRSCTQPIGWFFTSTPNKSRRFLVQKKPAKPSGKNPPRWVKRPKKKNFPPGQGSQKAGFAPGGKITLEPLDSDSINTLAEG